MSQALPGPVEPEGLFMNKCCQLLQRAPLIPQACCWTSACNTAGDPKKI